VLALVVIGLHCLFCFLLRIPRRRCSTLTGWHRRRGGIVCSGGVRLGRLVGLGSGRIVTGVGSRVLSVRSGGRLATLSDAGLYTVWVWELALGAGVLAAWRAGSRFQSLSNSTVEITGAEGGVAGGRSCVLGLLLVGAGFWLGSLSDGYDES
jgi:hypothetical protein